jgi:voltage-gated potassium channel
MTSFIIMVLLLFASSTMFYLEHEAQPDKFTDILTTLWWAVATLTTIGYGDIYPVTSVGKLLGGIVAILGVALVALPSGIITSGLIQESNKLKRRVSICPHCGKEVCNDDV